MEVDKMNKKALSLLSLGHMVTDITQGAIPFSSPLLRRRYRSPTLNPASSCCSPILPLQLFSQLSATFPIATPRGGSFQGASSLRPLRFR